MLIVPWLGYFLLFVMTSLGFRAIRDTLSHDPASQERVMGTFLFALSLADVRLFFLIHILTMLTKENEFQVTQ